MSRHLAHSRGDISPAAVDQQERRRPIRSFVRRQGRLTPGQQGALDRLWPRYGIELPEPSEQPLDLPKIYGRSSAPIVEIGFGNGESLLAMAQQDPGRDYLGIEVHRPGVGHLLMRIEEQGVENIRVMCADGVEVLRQLIASNTLAGLYLFFPDPWHKKRHHKRRQVNPDWAQLVLDRLQVDGVLHMATDHQGYAEQMMTVISSIEGFGNRYGAGCYAPRPDYRPATRFEERGRRLGHGVWDLIFNKTADDL